MINLCKSFASQRRINTYSNHFQHRGEIHIVVIIKCCQPSFSNIFDAVKIYNIILLMKDYSIFHFIAARVKLVSSINRTQPSSQIWNKSRFFASNRSLEPNFESFDRFTDTVTPGNVSNHIRNYILFTAVFNHTPDSTFPSYPTLLVELVHSLSFNKIPSDCDTITYKVLNNLFLTIGTNLITKKKEI